MKTIYLFLLLFSSQAFSEEIYLLPTKIGDRLFNDILVVESVGPNQLKGSLTVPGIFSVPVIKGGMKIDWNGFYYDFSIRVQENGEAYLVHYRIYLAANGEEKITGSLKLDDGTVIGEISNGALLKLE